MASTSTQNSKKAKKKTTRTKRISADEAAELAEQKAKEAVEKYKKEEAARREAEEFDTEEDHGGNSFLFGPEFNTEEDDVQEAIQQAEFDIFDYIHKNYVKQGVAVKFRVKKDGSLLGEFDIGVNWATLQEQYGGGFYRVQAVHAESKQIIKTQSQSILAREDKKKNEENTQTQNQSAPGPHSQLDINELMGGMMQAWQQMQSMAARDRKAEERDEKRMASEQNNLLLTLMQNQQQQQSTMLLEIAKMNQSTAEKQSQNFSRILEKMDEKNQKMFEQITNNMNKKEEFGFKDILAIMKEAEDKGADRMTQIMELAEMMKGDEPSGKEGAWSKLVSAILPMVANASKQQAAVPQPTMVPRGSLPQGQRPPQVTPPRPQAGHPARPQATRPHAAQTAAGPQRRPGSSPQPTRKNPARPGSVNPGPQGPQAMRQNPDLGKGAGFQEGPRPVTATRAGTPPASHGNPVPINEAEAVMQEASEKQTQIAGIAIPIIGECIFNENIKAKDAAVLCLDECAKVGFDADTVLKEFTFDDVMKVASLFELHETKRTWFEEFYNGLEDAAGGGSEISEATLS